MKTPAPYASFSRSLELWNRMAVEQATMLWSAGQVIGTRTAAMARHGATPNAKERREMHQMVAEKQSAAFEGSVAAWTECLRVAQASWLEATRAATRNTMSLAPMMIGLNAGNALARGNAYRRRAGGPTITSVAQRWSLDSLRIADAALKPVRKRVAANHKRLST